MTLLSRIHGIINRVMPSDVTFIMLQDIRTPTQLPVPANVSLAIMSQADVHSHAEISEYKLGSVIGTTRGDENNEFIGAYINGELAGYTAYAKGRIDPSINTGGSGFLGTGLEIPENTRFLGNAFVLERYRGLGLARMIDQFAANRHRALGADTFVATVGVSNKPACTYLRRCGYRTKAIAGEFRPLHRYRFFYIPSAIEVPRAEHGSQSQVDKIRMFKPDEG